MSSGVAAGARTVGRRPFLRPVGVGEAKSTGPDINRISVLAWGAVEVVVYGPTVRARCPLESSRLLDVAVERLPRGVPGVLLFRIGTSFGGATINAVSQPAQLSVQLIPQN
jgi:hypothetical protein